MLTIVKLIVKQLVVGAIIIETLLPIWAYGQRYETFRSEREKTYEEAIWHLGPFNFVPNFGLSLGYDNNVYQSSAKDAPIGDYAVSPSFGLDTRSYISHWIALSFGVNSGYLYYFEQKNLRGWNITVSPDLRILLLSRFALSGSYIYGNNLGRPTQEFDIPTRMYTETWSGRCFYEPGNKSTLGIIFAQMEYRYEDITPGESEVFSSETLDRKEYSTSFEFYREIYTSKRFFMRGDYTEYLFFNSEVQYKDSHSYSLYSGIEFPLIGDLRGIVSLGYKKLIPKDQTKQSFAGFVGDTSVEMRSSRILSRMFFKRDIPFSSGYSIYFINNSFGIGLSYYLTNFLRLNYDFTTGKSDYPGANDDLVSGPVEGTNPRNNLYRTHVGGITIRLIRNIGIDFSVNYWERSSDVPDLNSNRTYFVCSLAFDF